MTRLLLVDALGKYTSKSHQISQHEFALNLSYPATFVIIQDSFESRAFLTEQLAFNERPLYPIILHYIPESPDLHNSMRET